MRERVGLWLRIKTPDGGRPYVRPASSKNGMALVNGVAERHLEDGVYHLRYELPGGKRVREPVGRAYQSAEALRKIREGELSLNKLTPARHCCDQPAFTTLFLRKVLTFSKKLHGDI
jgi:hypothetical protein